MSRLESAVAIAQKYAKVAALAIYDRQVQLAIAIQVANCNKDGNWSDGVVRRRLKGAVPVPQQNTDRVAALVRYRQVQLAVAIEVSYGDRKRANTEKVPSPFPNKMLTVRSREKSGIAKSRLPSRLKSPTARKPGCPAELVIRGG